MYRPGNLKAGERRNVTVLFADMKGFTALSERMDPEEVDALMSRLFGAFESIIAGYGGTVEKYIGDALVAVFGVPELHEDDASRAVSSAIDFFSRINRINEERSTAPAVAFRIGINTGLITTGKRGEFDVVTGHTLSVAARLQSMAHENSILVSQSTRERCEVDFVFADRVEVSLKGKEDQVVAYRVTGRKTQPIEDGAVFIGRKSLVDSVFRAYLRHDQAEAGGVILTGPAGIGKTRVAQAVLDRVGHLPEFSSAVLYARARRYRTTPFAVVVDLLSGYCGITSTMGSAEMATLVCHDAEIEPDAALGFVRVATGQSKEPDSQVFVLLYMVLKSIVKKHQDAPYPVLVCIENLFFADKSSLDFFAFYLNNADSRPFFLCTDRTPDEATLTAFHGLATIEVPALDRDETLELVRAIHPEELDESVVSSILEHSGGNPLFVREYTRYASENRDAGALPSTVQNIFLTSIETYEPATRDLLTKLSVFVHSFTSSDAEYLQTATECDPSIAPEALELFVRNGLLVHEGSAYSFRYDLFKKALYSSLLNHNKRILHRIVANRMEENGNPHPARLLHHLVRSGEFDRATDFLTKPLVSSINMEFVEFLDQLIDHYAGTDSSRQISLMFLKSAILFNNGVTERVDSLLKRILEMAVRHRSHLFAGNAYHLLTAYNLKSYSFGKARACGTKALEHYAIVDEGRLREQNLLELMASAEIFRSDEGACRELIDRIRTLVERSDSSLGRCRLASIEAEHQILRGNYADAADVLDAAGSLSTEHSETWYGVQILAAMAAFLRCDWERAVEVSTAALAGPSKHSSNISQLHARIGVAHHFSGDAHASAQSLQQAEFTASQIRNDFDRVDALRTLSRCHLTCGDSVRAKPLALEGVTAGLRHSATYPVLTLLMTLVEIANAESDRESFDYFMSEATLLVESGTLLPNRDLILYHHDRAHDTGGAALKAAVRQEIDGIRDANLIDRFLALPVIGPIARMHRER